MSIEVVRDMTRAAISAFAAGGNAPVVASVSVIPAAMYTHDAYVMAFGCAPTNVVRCYLRPNADWDADELADFSVVATAGTNSIVFTIAAPGVFVGNFSIVYTIEA